MLPLHNEEFRRRCGFSNVTDGALPYPKERKKAEKEMEKHKIAVIGLGYVGLPLARLFSTNF